MQLCVLSEEDLDRIHQATLIVLEKTGVWFRDCPEAHEVFVRGGCTVDNDRVYIPPGVVAVALTSVANRNNLAAFFPGLGYASPLGVKQGETHFGLIGNAYYIYDFDTGKSRSCVETDVADKLLILDSLPNFEYDCCNLFSASERGIGSSMAFSYLAAADCAAFLRQWVSARAVSSRKKLPLGTRNCTDEEYRLTILGHAILEGIDATETLMRDGSSFPWVNPQSPLQYKADEARAMIASAQRGAWNQVSPEVMMGGTGPVTMAGAMVQHNAEVLAGLVLVQLARPKSPYIYGCVSAPMDLRNAQISQGNFEAALFNAAIVQVADHYGLPTRISPGNTSDPRTGSRALAETALGLYMGAAAGGNIITTSLLDSTLMVSYEHMVVVDELINQIRSITGGILIDSESLALDAIEEFSRPGNDFIASEHTMQFMQRDVYYSEFCGRIEASFEDYYERAHRRVKDILARRNRVEHVEKEVLSRLEGVEARIMEDDSTWRTGQGDWWTSYVRDL